MKQNKNWGGRRVYLLTALKYIISIVIFVLTRSTTGHRSYIGMALIELVFIAYITNWLAAKKPKLAYVINLIFVFLINAQMLILYFGGTYLSLIMLTNLGLVEDIGGKTTDYAIGVVAAVIAASLPFKSIKLPFSKKAWPKVVGLVSIVCIWLAAVSVFGVDCSPLASYVSLAKTWEDYEEYQETVASYEVDEEIVEEIFSDTIEGSYSKDEALVDQPNVILIFTEGLSQNVVEDERQLMPNVAALEAKSLYVDNYFNHTAATFRGVMGQLYSGYQLNETDENKLVSLQSIFSGEGYHTAFINTEWNIEVWTEWLETMGFDELCGYLDETNEQYGNMTDRMAYEYLMQKAQELNAEDEPFFLAMYTVGTHVTFNSTDMVYGDGTDPLLNRFYNADYWLGEFLEWFESSELAENTIIVFTADHCTYYNDEFTNAFPDYTRVASFCDEVPLCIYYVGMEASTIDANGRNTLDMAPTVLDFLDISAENYFLGESLFDADAVNDFNTIYTVFSDYKTTAGGVITTLSEEQHLIFYDLLTEYLALAQTGVN